MIEVLIDLLIALGIEVIVAPYEADAQLSYLVKTKQVDFAISEDSDVLVFGCTKMCAKFKTDKPCDFIELD